VPRATRISVIVLATVLFLAISFFLARWLTTESQERNDVFDLLKAQARGDARAMLADLDGCADSAACRAEVEANAARLRRSGNVKILAYDSKTSYTLGAAEGLTRVAWTVVDNGLPVVQCVDVRRGGNVLTGRTVSLRRLSAPIGRQSAC
jgi:hypothetical protein